MTGYINEFNENKNKSKNNNKTTMCPKIKKKTAFKKLQ